MKLTRNLLSEIINKESDAFYILDSRQFSENYQNLTNSFRKFYPKTKIAYSYKTNYVPRFCQLIKDLGGYAEVVSSMELELARRLGVEDKNIFFNGPIKNKERLISLLRGGGCVNIDSKEELDFIISQVDLDSSIKYKVGLRCNFDVLDGVVSRFGWDVGSPEFLQAINLINDTNGLEFIGLHCHFASRTLDCWINRTNGMLAILDKLPFECLNKIKYVSLGGGLYGNMPAELKKQFSVSIPTFDDYSKVAAKPFAEFFLNKNLESLPELIIEPGTALVADSMKFVCTVVSIKKIRGQSIATLSGSGYNINPNPNRKNVPIEVVRFSEGEYLSNVNFAGYTCIESDYLFKGYSGELGVGDLVIFDDVGSYSVVMKPPFILPNVPILELDGVNSCYSIIKRQETIDDLFQTYTNF
jgi:diaminopimelate decarboxylase